MPLWTDDMVLEKLDDVRSEIDMIKDTLFANFNERLVEISECVRAIDDRTKMFCPSNGSNRDGFEAKVMNSLEKHGKKINELRKAIK